MRRPNAAEVAQLSQVISAAIDQLRASASSGEEPESAVTKLADVIYEHVSKFERDSVNIMLAELMAATIIEFTDKKLKRDALEAKRKDN
jgi:hypothetical protein